jgi:predicted membrane-bound spermidine synthase
MVDETQKIGPAQFRPLLGLLFVSGASGLMFEIIWVRAIGLHFGTTTPAISTVLAAFMAGLATGNWLFGPRADRHPRPVHLYRWLELGIGLGGLVISLLLLEGGALLAMFARAIAMTGPLQTPLRFLLFFVLLLVPTTLMGGTLPVLSRALVRSGDRGAVVGALYAVNTAGATVGALAPDLWLIPSLGLWATAGVAALGNLAVAATVVRFAPAESAPVPEQAKAAPTARLPIIIYAASGFCAMGYEVVWSRLARHWTADLVTSFSVLLAVFLAFVALGARLTTRLADRVRDPLATAAWMLMAAGLLAFAPVLFAGSLPEAIASFVANLAGDHARLGPGLGLLSALLISLFLEALPCLLMGAGLPMVAAVAVREGHAGQATGRLYAANTVAGVLSSILAGFVIMPLLGLQRALWLLASIAVLAGAAVIWWLPGSKQRRAGAGVLAATLLVGGLLVPSDHLRRAYFSGENLHISTVREGATTTAAGAVSMPFGEPAHLELLTPGVAMSSTGFAARRYMGLMAHLPLLFSAGGREALLICYGVGNTARSLLAHQRLARLDVVDISEEVLSLADFFAPAHGGNPLRDPRVRVHLDDGRQHLLTTSNRYDVVTSEPPPPVSAGVVNLYSREFYAAAKRALNPGGVLAQWLPIFQLAREETLAIVAAFEAEFPHTALFHGHGYQWILLGSDQPLRIRAERWLSATREPGVAEDFARIGVAGFGDLLASYLQNDRGLRALVRGVSPLTDDLPSIQYPRRGLYGLEIPPGIRGAPSDVLALIDGRETLLGDGVLDETTRALRSMSLVHIALPALWYGSLAARELMVGAPLMHALHFQPSHPYLLDLLHVGSERGEPAQAALARGRELVEARWVLARRSFYARDWVGTLAQLDRIQAQAVGPAKYWLLRAGAERALGQLDRARASFHNAAEASREPAFKQAIANLVANIGRAIEPWASPLSLQSPEPE